MVAFNDLPTDIMVENNAGFRKKIIKCEIK